MDNETITLTLGRDEVAYLHRQTAAEALTYIGHAMRGALKGLADGLDADSSYLTPDLVKALESNASAGPADIGVVLIRQYYRRVVATRDGSPAAKAGLRTGDFVRAIDNRATRDMTVFEGTRVEEFRATVLGVLDNVFGARRSLILARLEGGPLANAGVIAGMSGSPVYVDGKLMGAVSYSLGQFSTEPIAGITPISEMIDATMMSASLGSDDSTSFWSTAGMFPRRRTSSARVMTSRNRLNSTGFTR